MALTIGGKDFERAGATGMMKGSGIFMHDSAADRPAPEFAGTSTIHTGGAHASYLLLPRIPQCDALNVPQYLPPCGGGRRAKRVGRRDFFRSCTS